MAGDPFCPTSTVSYIGVSNSEVKVLNKYMVILVMAIANYHISVILFGILFYKFQLAVICVRY